MPTYQYECESCGHGFEVMQSIKDAKLKKCPKCQKPKLHRLIGSGSGFVFKGRGFYETDYKQKGSSAPVSCPAKDSSKSSCACCPAKKA